MTIDATDAPAAEAVSASVVALPGDVIDGGEIVLLTIKPSMWRPVFDSISWLVTCCAVAAILVSARLTLPGLSLIASAQFVLMVGLVRLGIALDSLGTDVVCVDQPAYHQHQRRAPAAYRSASTGLAPKHVRGLLLLGATHPTRHDRLCDRRPRRRQLRLAIDR